MEYLNELQLTIGAYKQNSRRENSAILHCDPVVNFNESPAPFIPWHWHDSVELFYVESGCFEYITTREKMIFAAGSGGFINSNVIHMMRWIDSENSNVLWLYKFNLSSVLDMSRTDVKKMIGSKIGLVPFSLDDNLQARILKKLKITATLLTCKDDNDALVRDLLAEIMDAIIQFKAPFVPMDKVGSRTDLRLKKMMSYTHQHYQESFRMSCISEIGQLSSNSCHRLFRDKLLLTPVDYVNEVRLYFGCLMLAETNEYIEIIAARCGFCTSSYFGKLFKERFNCTPMEYRLIKQNNRLGKNDK